MKKTVLLVDGDILQLFEAVRVAFEGLVTQEIEDRWPNIAVGDTFESRTIRFNRDLKYPQTLIETIQIKILRIQPGEIKGTMKDNLGCEYQFVYHIF